MTKNLNIYPYYDDYEKDKNFHKVLFVPGRPVQARELTQLQTILQEQISRHGNHVFKNGTVVIPGHIYYDNTVIYVRLQETVSGVSTDSFIDMLVGQELVGQTSGVTAKVIHVERSTQNDPPTLFVRFVGAGEATSETSFRANEELQASGLSGTSVFTELSEEFIGRGSIVTIDEGVYYINGYFVSVQKQSLVLSKYTTTPSAKVGLGYDEEIITEKEDSSLYDVALGFSNFTAPGAHRLKISLSLTAKPLDYVEPVGESVDTGSTELRFIDLLQVKAGTIQYMVNDTMYAELEKLLARRTFDESGDYIVKPFGLDITEFRNNNRGAWQPSTVYLQGDIVTATVSGKTYFYYARSSGISGSNIANTPVHTFGTMSDGGVQWTQTSIPFFNNGVFSPEASETIEGQSNNEAKLVAIVKPGKAYVNGFEISKPSTSMLVIDKAREFKFVNSSEAFAPDFTYVDATAVTGGLPNIKQAEKYDVKDAGGAIIGSFRVRNISQISGGYRIYVFDVSMASGKDFQSHAKSAASGSKTITFKKSLTRLSGTANILIGSLNTVNGINTNFDEELRVGATVFVNGTGAAGASESRVVNSLTDTTLVLSSNLSNAATGVTIDAEYVSMVEGVPNIVELPNKYIKTLRNEEGVYGTDTNYVVNRFLSNQADGNIILTGDASGETFMPDGHITSAGTLTYVDNKTLTLSGGGGSASVILRVRKKNSAAREKTKSLQVKTVYVFDDGVYANSNKTGLITNESNFKSKKISLTEADALRIIRVAQSAAATSPYVTSGEVDITDRFELEDGQTPHYYGISKASRLGPIPTKPLCVTFEYFDHSVGDYFSIDSYSTIPYNMVPVYGSSTKVYQLRDCLDFRPRIDDNGVGFTDVGDVITDGDIIVFDYSYYLPRIDKIELDSTGEVAVIKGIASDTPDVKKTDAGKMRLFEISLQPFTLNTNRSNVTAVEVQHRRFTMKDISDIEKRLTNVEEQVALTLLEKKTADLKVTDSFGLDRFKNGFFVDQFVDGEVSADVADHKVSIDQVAGECRPQYFRDVISAIEPEGTSQTIRRSKGYQVTGSIATLPYSDEILINQTVASYGCFINPFNVASFNGNLRLFPNNDAWTENVQLSDRRVSEVMGNRAQLQSRPRVEQRWNSWRWSSFSQAAAFWAGNVTEVFNTTQRFQRERTVTNIDTEISRTRNFVGVKKNAVSKMRKKKTVVFVEGLRPFSSVYPYFNKQNALGTVTPTTEFYLTAVSGEFLGFNKLELQSDNLTARTASDVDYDVFNNGEVVQVFNGSTLIGTAVVVHYDVAKVGGVDKKIMRVVNIKTSPSATAGHTLKGLRSGATATIESVVSGTFRTDSLGNFFGVMSIPDGVHNTGTAQVEVMDTATGDAKSATTRASTTYTASGDIAEYQDFVSYRLDAVETLSDWRLTNTTTSLIATIWPNIDGGGGGDPLTQSFVIPADRTSGVFVTGVDIFFHSKAVGETLPVRVQICEMVNGYPSTSVLPYSSISKSASEITASDTTLVPTRFKFDSPVYLRPGVEYGVKVLTDSFAYKVWAARMGERRVDDPTLVVTEQPSTGVLFKSQNNSTWSAEQMEDLSFVLYCANFDTSRSGNVDLVNAELRLDELPPDPFMVKDGATKVKVFHPGHGFVDGMSVTFSGSTVSSFNSTFTVSDTTIDYYYVTLGAAYVTSPSGINLSVGGDAIKATTNRSFDVVNFMCKTFTPEGGSINYSMRPYQSGSAKESIYRQMPSSFDVLMDSTRYILSKENEGIKLGGAKSLDFRINISSTNKYTSPMVDLSSPVINTINNRADNETALTANVSGTVDYNQVTVGSTVFEADDDSMTVTSNAAEFQIGEYVTISGTVSNNHSTPVKVVNVVGNKVFLDVAIVDETVTPTVNILTGFIDEIASEGGSRAAKYLSNQITLSELSTSLKIMFAANIPNEANVDLYYRIGNGTLDDKPWTIIPTSYKKNSRLDEFLDQEYDLDNLSSFSTFQVKVVFRTTNTSRVPRIKDLRVIALA